MKINYHKLKFGSRISLLNNLLFVGYLLMLTSFLGCAKPQIKNVDSRGEKIVCFGDSITYGYGVDVNESYPAVLSGMLGKEVLNKGLNGDTTTEGLKRLQKDVLDNNPYLVVVEFGGNDFMNKIPLAKTLDNLRDMVRSIQAKGAMVAVMDVSSGLFLREYRSAYSKLANEMEAIFIPSSLGGIITNPNLKSDFLHPNPEGYKLVAKRVYNAVSPYLGKYAKK